jgi:DNA-binding NarL/FixJ family response regulator
LKADFVVLWTSSNPGDTAERTAIRERAVMITEPKFTHREIEIIQHLQLGDTNKIIGRALGISECTVKIHIRNILRKVNANNRTQAAMRVKTEMYAPQVMIPQGHR